MGTVNCVHLPACFISQLNLVYDVNVQITLENRLFVPNLIKIRLVITAMKHAPEQKAHITCPICVHFLHFLYLLLLF
jgi:antitoxin component of MazEF toxin-antitoxin module